MANDEIKDQVEEQVQEAAAEHTEEQSVEALQAALAAAQEELTAVKDQSLRALAEAQNIKRRAELDVENARKYGNEKIISELLPVVDNLERALQSTSSDLDEIKPIVEGVELTLKSFLSALDKVNVIAVDPHGEPFDPQHHQAMSMVENAEVEPNTVIAVMQKGYTLNGRLLRPAMVMVSRAPAGSVDETA